MTEKRFTFTQDTLAKADVFDGSEFVCCTLSVWVEQLVDLLNQLNDENEFNKLKILYLTRENKALKKELDFIQNSITESIKHQKTELAQKALKKIIEDYNNYLINGE